MRTLKVITVILALSTTWLCANQEDSDSTLRVRQRIIELRLDTLLQHQKKVEGTILDLEFELAIAEASDKDARQTSRVMKAVVKHREKIQLEIQTSIDELGKIQQKVAAVARLTRPDERKIAPVETHMKQVQTAEERATAMLIDELRLRNLENDLSDLLKRYKSGHPQVVALREEIDNLKRRLESHRNSPPDNVAN